MDPEMDHGPPRDKEVLKKNNVSGFMLVRMTQKIK